MREGTLDYTNVYLDQDVPLWDHLPTEAAMTIGRFMRPASDPGMAVLSFPLLDPLRTNHWLTLIEMEQRLEPSQATDAAIAHLAALFLIDVSRSMRDGVRRPVPWEDAAVGRAVSYMEAHFSDSLSLAVLAQAAGISPWELCRRCRSCTGLSVGDLIRTRRVEEALRLLHDPDQRIIEIAYATGFGSVTAFNRAFKQQVGKTPRDYRTTTTR
jgi:AraC-like DNA-binding protein